MRTNIFCCADNALFFVSTGFFYSYPFARFNVGYYYCCQKNDAVRV